MAFTCRVHDSIDQTDLQAWHQVVDSNDDPYMNPRFIRTIERSLAPGIRVWTVLVYDEAQRPVAAACLSLQTVDAASMSGPIAKRMLAATRRIFPRYLYFRVLFCGLPASAGQSQLRIVPDTDAPGVVRAIDTLLRTLAREHRARAVIVKEFGPEQCDQLAPLSEAGFVRAPSVAAFVLRAGGCNFDEYCRSLKSHYRAPITRSIRKFHRSAIRFEHVRGDERFAERYTDEFHRLYDAVLSQAPVQIDILPAGYFRELSRQFGGDFHATLAFDGRRPVGFVVGVFQSGTYYAMFIGLDYEVNRATDLYFNLLYESMAYAMNRRVETIDFGPDSERFKARIGCQPQRRAFFIHVPGVLGIFFRIFSRLMFPPMAEPETMNAFKPTEPAEAPADGSWRRVDTEPALPGGSRGPTTHPVPHSTTPLELPDASERII